MRAANFSILIIVELATYEEPALLQNWMRLSLRGMGTKRYLVFAILALYCGATLCVAPTVAQNPASSNELQLPSPSLAASLAILRKGTQLIDAGRLPDALGLFQQYVRERPGDPSGYFWIGVCYDEMSNFQYSAQAYRDGISRAEQNGMDSAEMRTNLGNVYLKQNDLEQAIDSYKRAIEVNPQYALAELNLARAFISKADYPSALSALDKCDDLHCNLRQSSYYRAKALLASGKREEASALVHKLLQDFPAGEARNSLLQEFQSCLTH